MNPPTCLSAKAGLERLRQVERDRAADRATKPRSRPLVN